jgi:hypothetical protein
MSSALLNNPPPAGTTDVEAEFRRLAEWWNRETAFLSDLNKMFEHPAYRQIVALGPPVIPILLHEMQVNRDWWVGALHELTGANPGPPEHVGRLKDMAADWVAWGRENGYIE